MLPKQTAMMYEVILLSQISINLRSLNVVIE